MYKAVFLVAALALTPLPAMSQEPQQQRGQSGGDQQMGTSGGGAAGGSMQQRDGTGDGGGADESSRSSRRDDILDRLSRSELRDRVAMAMGRVEDACGDDIDRFCGEVTPGRGRIAACMEAYSDQLSRRCRFTLRRVSGYMQTAVRDVADSCRTAIRTQCGDAENRDACMGQKVSSLPPSCQMIVAAARQYPGMMASAQSSRMDGGSGQATADNGQQSQSGQQQSQSGSSDMRGMPVYSSDGVNLGKVVQIDRSSDGSIKSVKIEIGRLLGLGDKVVNITSDELQQMADRIKLRLNSDQVRKLPESKSGQQTR
ncbi:PRC-barrel domain protein [Rhodomicrobium vannielii ATCC 17100]|uniref:PRC-barrel domain protein n=1 Tax=Rhodomicrobium vannielii (strain ATCC 17100 / DSM 162 / LMG 4299 / NCIMB 10020 / ATH 3.1.1) TaxID=648757 RepID=E3I6F8_RHOVT|nr:PRC-barrel domain-containing protein [Rhodomicrobium vannielii]ADP69519.1 PRC-barrel domain protein [Rhodomicrobium vannielii ATCC 17100]